MPKITEEICRQAIIEHFRKNRESIERSLCGKEYPFLTDEEWASDMYDPEIWFFDFKQETGTGAYETWKPTHYEWKFCGPWEGQIHATVYTNLDQTEILRIEAE